MGDGRGDRAGDDRPARVAGLVRPPRAAAAGGRAQPPHTVVALRDNLGISVTRLHLAVQGLLIDELARRGHPGVRARHGAVLAHVGDGVRATDLSAAGGRSKQTVTRLIDELEQLGYVERRPDPQDRRGKLVVLTDLGAAEVRTAREILAEVEESCSAIVGAEDFAAWQATTVRLIDHLAGSQNTEQGEP